MYKKILLVVFCVCSLFFAVSCGNGEPAPGDEGTITIEVINNTEEIIISLAVFFGPDLDEWGEELLGDRVIVPGETIRFVLPQSEYSLVLCTYEIYVVHSISNINTDMRIEVGDPDKLPVLVVNNSDKDIVLFYISPSVSDSWGDELLGDDIISAEIGRRFFFIDPVPDFPEAPSGNGENGKKNDNEGEASQGADVEEDETLPTGSSYDILYIYSDGEEIVEFNVIIDGKETTLTIH